MLQESASSFRLLSIHKFIMLSDHSVEPSWVSELLLIRLFQQAKDGLTPETRLYEVIRPMARGQILLAGVFVGET
jgi:hypothetical protein